MELVAGIAVSLIVQVLKKWLGSNKVGTYLLLAALSLVGAGIYQYLVMAGYWETVARVLVSAAGFYALVIKQIDVK